MCATVTVEDIDPAAPVWDREQVTIVIGLGLDYFQALRQVRSLLLYLGAPQMGLGATCWCGDYVSIPRPVPGIPSQRASRGLREAHHAG